MNRCFGTYLSLFEKIFIIESLFRKKCIIVSKNIHHCFEKKLSLFSKRMICSKKKKELQSEGISAGRW